MIEVGDQLKQNLLEESNQTWIKDIFSEVDETTIEKATDFVYENLPLFLTEKDYHTSTHSNTGRYRSHDAKELYQPSFSRSIALRGLYTKRPLGLGITY
jgi:hypothetical protein